MKFSFSKESSSALRQYRGTLKVSCTIVDQTSPSSAGDSQETKRFAMYKAASARRE